jgi:putative ABC transport system permease protein
MKLLKLALNSLLERKMRSLLTMLGIIIGVAAVYAMLVIGNGAKDQIMDSLGGINSRSISLNPNWTQGRASNRKPYRRFTESDVEQIRGIRGAEAVSGMVNSSESVVVPGTDSQSDIRGTDQDYLAANDMKLTSGRNLRPEDLEFSGTVAILGSSAAERLFGKSYPIGATVVIKRIPFEVIGVLDTYEAQWSRGNDENDFIVIPRTTMRARISGDDWLVKNKVDSIQVVGETTESLTFIETEVDSILRRSRNLSAADAPDFRIFNFSANRQQRAEGQQMFTILLASIGVITLVVGGVGVMNIMLVSVAERTREIGLRMSVGARASDILLQFLVEALVLCAIGGAIGLALGFGAGEFAERSSNVGNEAVLKIRHSAPTAMLAFGSALFTGVVFGFLPARRASRLNPVEALRHE